MPFAKGYTPWNKGGTSWNKGKKFSAKTRAKMAAAKLGKKRKPFTAETRARIAAAKYGPLNPCYGKYRTRNPNWKGGSSIDRRTDSKYLKWRLRVFKRDGFSCRECQSNKRLHAHHIKRFSTYPRLRYRISNGLTLCYNCHKAVHRKAEHVIATAQE